MTEDQRAAIERMHENESLTGELTDPQARALLGWGEEEIQAGKSPDAVFAAIRTANKSGAQSESELLAVAQSHLDSNSPPAGTASGAKSAAPSVPTKAGSSGGGLWIVGCAVLVLIALVLGGILLLGGGLGLLNRAASQPVAVAQNPSPPAVVTSPIAPTPSVAPSLVLPAAYAASGDWYRVYFSKPLYPERASDRHGGIDDALVADLDAAQHSIDAAVFDIDLPSVVDALGRALARGVKVRVVADDDANQESDKFNDALAAIKKAGIPVTLDNRPAFMHNKFIIIDDSIVWTGSWNLTVNDTYRNDNNTLRFSIPPLSQNYKTRFEHLFAGQLGAKAPKDTPNPRVTLPDAVTIENYFSPNGGAANAIETRLRNAQSDIRVLAFTYTADPQAKILVDRHNAGIKVQGVFEARNAEGSGADFDMLKQAGLDVLEDGNCYVMHNKIYIIDDRTVITGSYNYTSNAEHDNDENLLIIDDPTLANWYNQEFDRIYVQAQSPTKCGS